MHMQQAYASIYKEAFSDIKGLFLIVGGGGGGVIWQYLHRHTWLSDKQSKSHIFSAD